MVEDPIQVAEARLRGRVCAALTSDSGTHDLPMAGADHHASAMAERLLKAGALH